MRYLNESLDRSGSSLGLTRPNVSTMGLVCFGIGLCAPFRTRFVGDLYWFELLLPVVALGCLLLTRIQSLFSMRALWVAIAAILVSLSGYMLSDIVRGTEPVQYLRGWGRWVLLLSACVSVAILVSCERFAVWWIGLGFGLGGIAYLLLINGQGPSIWNWKIYRPSIFGSGHFGYAMYVGVLWAALGPFLGRRIAAIGFLALMVVNFYWDYRSMALICCLVGAICWITPTARVASGVPRLHRGLAAQRSRGLVVLLAVLVCGAALYVALARSEKWEGSDSAATQYDFGRRREESSLGRWMDIVVAARAIAASPIVGYGSWGRSSEVAQIDREVQRDYAERSNRPIEVSDHASRGHSQFLQSWTEGGVLGTAFFLVLGGMLLRSGAQVVLARHADSLTPSLLFWIGYALWSVAQSPFGERFSIAIPFACILGLELERKRKRTAHGLPARRPTASAHRFPTSRVERSQ